MVNRLEKTGHWSQEEQRRLLLDNILEYAIFMLTPTGVIESWTKGGERVFGYAPEEAVGKSLRDLYPPDGVEQADEELRVAAAPGRAEQEGWRMRKDGTRFWANAVLTAIRDDAGKI